MEHDELTVARDELEKLVAELEAISESAARSLEEGLDETLTLHRLGAPPTLKRSLREAFLIESCFPRTKKLVRNVKHWSNANMVLRWAGTTLTEAEKNFQRVKGYRSMPSLVAAVRVSELATMERRDVDTEGGVRKVNRAIEPPPELRVSTARGTTRPKSLAPWR